tara:strand:- start:1987 stop:2178 length:192 start_codon:yes stop_codon:yes gene_type:complete
MNRLQELITTHPIEVLAEALINSVNGELSLLDNGCGNCLDFDKRLQSRIKHVYDRQEKYDEAF